MQNFDTHVNQIVDFVREGKIIPFIGAGASINATKASVDWNTLANRLAEKLDLTKNDHDPIDVIQYYEDQKGESALRQQVKKYLTPKKDRKLDLVLQEQLCSWPIDTIITTNYDDFLERACNKAGIEPDVIHLNNLKDWSHSNKLKIFKIHGDLGNEMVLTQKNYQNYEVKHSGAFHLLQTLILTRPILFVGCSLTDPNFKRAYFRVMSFLKSGEKHYAFFRKEDHDEAKMWSPLKINTLYLGDKNNSVTLSSTLKDITKKCQLHANTIEGRKNIFENFEKQYLRYPLKDLEIRKETALGFICIPDDESINIYDNFDEEEEQIEERLRNAKDRKNTYEQYIKKGASVKIIVSVNPSKLSERGYRGHEKHMLNGLREFIEKHKNKDNFEIVKRGPILEWSNTTIYDDDSMIESRPLRTEYGVKDRLDVILDRKIIAYMTQLFDERFDFYATENLADIETRKILPNLTKKIQKLKSKNSKSRELTKLVNTALKEYVIKEISLEIDCNDAKVQLSKEK